MVFLTLFKFQYYTRYANREGSDQRVYARRTISDLFDAFQHLSVSQTNRSYKKRYLNYNVMLFVV